jgi:Uncharacterized protein conserved in bacteria (DUF2147)
MIRQRYTRTSLTTRAAGFSYRSVTMALETALLSALIWSAAVAGELSPVGLWKTIDDNTGKPRGLVRIMEVNGEYQGKVEKIFIEPGEDRDPKCEKCDGARHNQPVIGMTILWGLTTDERNHLACKPLRRSLLSIGALCDWMAYCIDDHLFDQSL